MVVKQACSRLHRLLHTALLRALLVLVLGWQLLLSGQHHHDLTRDDHDCAACLIAHQLAGGAPADAPLVQPISRTAIILVQLPSRQLRRLPPPHVLPFAQAPPAIT